MSNPFFDHPILNSPCEYPMKYWELDETGQPTQKIIERRRSAKFITPPGAEPWQTALDAANAAPRCGARCRSGLPCRGPAMAAGRCRMHGGASTGPRTATGLEQSRKARWRHGRRSAESRAAARERGEARAVLIALRRLLDEA